MPPHKNIAVVIEQSGGSLHPASLELLGEGRRLAGPGCLTAVLAGSGIKPLAKQCIAFGADCAVYADSPALKEYTSSHYITAVAEILTLKTPDIALFSATPRGREIAPSISVRLGTGLTADCTGLSWDGDQLVMTRPTLGGNLMADIICPERHPQMATVRQGVFDSAQANPQRRGILEEFSVAFREPSPIEVLETIAEISAHRPITAEEVLVVGGRGLGTEANFQKLAELAELLHGGVGVSRGLVEQHWAACERQVGQTGKTVRPKFYLALGISGAIQHITGMEHSDFILAVNSDREAPIFKFSHLGVVTDARALLPKLIEALKKAQD